MRERVRTQRQRTHRGHYGYKEDADMRRTHIGSALAAVRAMNMRGRAPTPHPQSANARIVKVDHLLRTHIGSALAAVRAMNERERAQPLHPQRDNNRILKVDYLLRTHIGSALAAVRAMLERARAATAPTER